MNMKGSHLVYEKDSPTDKESLRWMKSNALAIGILLALLGVIFFISFITPGRYIDEVASEENTEEISILSPSGFFENLDLEAKAYVVFDVKNQKVLYAKNADAQLPLASLSKMMTAVVVRENLEGEDVIIIKNKDLLTEGDSGLLEGESWYTKDLTDFTLVVSSNDGASALASAVESLRNKDSNKEIRFIDLMNDKALQLNMNQTYFLNASGLDIEEKTQSGSYGSAHDITALFSYALKEHPDLFGATSEEDAIFFSKDTIPHVVSNTNQEMKGISGVFASKTGYTDLAGGNLIVGFDAGIMQPYSIVVLGSSREGRFKDVQKLHDATRAFLNQEISASFIAE